jgi:hypothetical protein
LKVIATQDALNRETFIDVTIEPGSISEVIMEPLDVVLDIGATQHFLFKAFDEFGNEISNVPASWSIAPDIGTIDVNGFLTVGTKAGSFPDAVQVEVIQGTESVSVMADVSVRPDPLATVEVDPSYVVVEEGATQLFTAEGFDQFGNEISGLEFLWSGSGYMDQAGLFIAVRPWGTYSVTASVEFEGSTIWGLAKVEIPPSVTLAFWDSLWDLRVGIRVGEVYTLSKI